MSNASKPAGLGQKLPVVICEFHQEVLEFIHRHIAKKKLPFHNINMVHFDSHPDLAYPNHLLADDCKNKEKMYNDLEISDWILPLMYMNHVTSLLWVKPFWAKQIEEGDFQFAIGKEKGTGCLRVTLDVEYFLEDCTYSNKQHLSDTSAIKLKVATLESLLADLGNAKKDLSQNVLDGGLSISSTNGKEKDEKRTKYIDTNIEQQRSNPNPKEKLKRCSKNMNESNAKRRRVENCYEFPTNDEKYILDIDLDFFSVTNPFLKDFTKEEYTTLKNIYSEAYCFPKDRNCCEEILQKAVENSREKLESLKHIISEYSNGRTTTDNPRLLQLLDEIKERRKGEDVDWMMIHEAGLTTDLPHHISTEREIDNLLVLMEDFMKKLPRPALITIARSTLDEYCPPSQVESIQRKTLEVIRNLYGELFIIEDYKDESRLL